MSNTRQAAETSRLRAPLFFAIMTALIVLEGLTSGWNSALGILNMGLISAIMALGVNMQWGYAGLFNAGAMGFVALGGLAPVLISMPPTQGAFKAGGFGLIVAFIIAIVAVLAAVWLYKRLRGLARGLAVAAVLIVGFFAYRFFFDPAVSAIEAINPSAAGNLGGLGQKLLMTEFFHL